MVASLLVLCTACSAGPANGGQQVRAVPLFEHGAEAPARIGSLELLGAYDLRARDPDFGGLSGARLDGDRLVLLSDRSSVFELGWPGAIDGGAFTMPVHDKVRLRAARGQLLDAEALALTAEGDLLVGDETDAAVYRFPRGQRFPVAQPWRLPPAFTAGGTANVGLESVASLADGTVIAIAEGLQSEAGGHALALLGEGGTVVKIYRAGPGFQPTDADVAGDRLLVLERRFTLMRGWQSRIAAVPLSAVQDDDNDVLEGVELAAWGGATLGENYEGLAVRQEADGTFLIVVVADSNFSPLQRSRLLALRWRP